MAGQELARGHRPLAFGLDLDDARAARRRSRRSADRRRLRAIVPGGPTRPASDLVRPGASTRRDRRSPQDHALAVDEAERVRPRMQTADQIVDARGRPAPVDHAVFLRQPMRVGRLARRPAASPRRCRARSDRRRRRAGARRSARGRARPRRWSRRRRSADAPSRSSAPASSALTTRMIVTPVSCSPAITARCTGAAPR